MSMFRLRSSVRIYRLRSFDSQQFDGLVFWRQLLARQLAAVTAKRDVCRARPEVTKTQRVKARNLMSFLAYASGYDELCDCLSRAGYLILDQFSLAGFCKPRRLIKGPPDLVKRQCYTARLRSRRMRQVVRKYVYRVGRDRSVLTLTRTLLPLECLAPLGPHGQRRKSFPQRYLRHRAPVDGHCRYHKNHDDSNRWPRAVCRRRDA
jgi:hypothetical protein